MSPKLGGLFRWAVVVVLIALAAGIWWTTRTPAWERFAPVASVLPDDLRARSEFPPAEALSCKACHLAEFEAWMESQHAHANRLVSEAQDQAAFTPPRSFHEGLLKTDVSKRWKTFLVTQTGPGPETSYHQAVAVIGVAPLIQYLTPFPGGRLQTINPAYDPVRKDWFDTFGGEERLAHEWGFWKNQGLNWNSQCAFCHTTDFRKNYDIATDSYASTWTAMGISCSQCHGPMDAHVANPQLPVPERTERQVMSNCASCHARREELTGDFRPGRDFDDHYRLVLPDLTDTYHPDGQVRDENFEYASFITSKMGHAGVRCIDCHNPHSAKLKLPVENNAMCMSCHSPPGINNATPIHDPVAHSHHGADSTGNRCVECHMPHTIYMARDPRRDHGFTIPDPLLTIEHNIPNACNRCHTDQSADWAQRYTEQWYGEKMARPSRERARLMARARAGDPTVTAPILSFLAKEENPAWRAALISALQGRATDPSVEAYLKRAVKDSNALVRNAAVTVLAPGSSATLQAALDDEKRTVRLAAAWGLAMSSHTLPHPQREEIVKMLENQSDQPTGALRQAQLAAVEDRPSAANDWLKRATSMDPSSGMYERSATLQYSMGDEKAAREAFSRAITADPTNVSAIYGLALLEGELGNTSATVELLQTATRLDPDFTRAWYNLGLAEAGREKLAEASVALSRAADLSMNDPSPAYALATIHLRQNKPKEARAAALRALKIDPNHRESLNLLRSLDR